MEGGIQLAEGETSVELHILSHNSKDTTPRSHIVLLIPSSRPTLLMRFCSPPRNSSRNLMVRVPEIMVTTTTRTLSLMIWLLISDPRETSGLVFDLLSWFVRLRGDPNPVLSLRPLEDFSIRRSMSFLTIFISGSTSPSLIRRRHRRLIGRAKESRRWLVVWKV